MSLLAACNCNSGDYYSFVGNNTFAFNIIDKKTRQDLLMGGQNAYYSDSVKVYDTKWIAKSNQPALDGQTTFSFIERSDENILHQPIERRFYIFFRDNDIDTLDFVFQMTLDDCKDQRLSHFKVSYNDSVYFDGPTSYPPHQNFLKEYY